MKGYFFNLRLIKHRIYIFIVIFVQLHVITLIYLIRFLVKIKFFFVLDHCSFPSIGKYNFYEKHLFYVIV